MTLLVLVEETFDLVDIVQTYFYQTYPWVFRLIPVHLVSLGWHFVLLPTPEPALSVFALPLLVGRPTARCEVRVLVVNKTEELRPLLGFSVYRVVEFFPRQFWTLQSWNVR